MTALKTGMNYRNNSIDIIKGLACVFMVVAHIPFATLLDPTIKTVNYISGIAAILFFATAAISASHQTNKYTNKSLIYYFLILSILGINWNTLVHGNHTAFYWPEIFQTIAFGSIAVCLLERKQKASQYTLLIIGFSFLFIKLLMCKLWPDTEGLNYLIRDNDYTPLVQTGADNAVLFPGFPIFPWVGTFFLGLFCYRLQRIQRLYMSLICLAGAMLANLLGSVIVEKWDTSTAYFLGSLAFMSAFFWLFDDSHHYKHKLLLILQQVGSHSLLFFFIHPVAILTGFIAYAVFPSPYMAWSVAIFVSVIATLKFAKFRKAKFAESKKTWIVASLLSCCIPMITLISINASFEIITRLLAFMIGVFIALNYVSLAKLIKKKRANVSAIPEVTKNLFNENLITNPTPQETSGEALAARRPSTIS